MRVRRRLRRRFGRARPCAAEHDGQLLGRSARRLRRDPGGCRRVRGLRRMVRSPGPAVRVCRMAALARGGPPRRLPDLPFRPARRVQAAGDLAHPHDGRPRRRRAHGRLAGRDHRRVLHAARRLRRAFHRRARTPRRQGVDQPRSRKSPGRAPRVRDRSAGRRGADRRDRGRAPGREGSRRRRGHRRTGHREPGLDHRRVDAGRSGPRRARLRGELRSTRRPACPSDRHRRRHDLRPGHQDGRGGRPTPRRRAAHRGHVRDLVLARRHRRRDRHLLREWKRARDRGGADGGLLLFVRAGHARRHDRVDRQRRPARSPDQGWALPGGSRQGRRGAARQDRHADVRPASDHGRRAVRWIGRSGRGAVAEDGGGRGTLLRTSPGRGGASGGGRTPALSG
ncbi:hypothetical protein CHKEEEPN_4822 [Methylorubrum podarium]|nr:hypothetical protein CHKEEEPN_4822 [Methylorubrum podarium]